jgi:GTP-dependent phosphoenolpyruvate carboxykinase
MITIDGKSYEEEDLTQAAKIRANHIADLQERKTEYLLLLQDIEASIASQAQSIKEELEGEEE